MLLSLCFVSLLSLGVISQNPSSSEDFIQNEILEAREEFSSTYLTSRGTYISFYYGAPTDDCNKDSDFQSADKDEQFRTTGYFSSDYHYINNKYFQIGYSATYNTSLIVGKTQILDPYGQAPEYQTVYGLTLPAFDTAHNSIRNAGFVFKRKSGTLSSVMIYKVDSPAYSNINGTSTLSKSFIGYTSISSNYSTIDITDEVASTISSSPTPLNILIVGTSNNNSCYLYTSTESSSNAPYFYIEYDNYGIAPAYSTLVQNTNSNCFGFILNYNQSINIGTQLNANLTNNAVIINSQNNTFYSYYENIIINIVNNQTTCFHLTTSKQTDLNLPIATNSRRIMMRLKTNNYKYAGDYHFMCECNDGTWAEKAGSGECNQYSSRAVAEAHWGVYNSPTIYLLLTAF